MSRPSNPRNSKGAFSPSAVARGALMVAALAAFLAMAQTVSAGNERHVVVKLEPVAGSGVSGQVKLFAMSGGGTLITVHGIGLQSGVRYFSLYYDGHACELEPYSEEDIITESSYAANSGGTSNLVGIVDDDLDEINSVSIRLASDFSLLACADVHPGQ